MRVINRGAASLIACAVLFSGATAPAAASDMVSAEKIRKLDIMLMVSALRCRHSADGFQADYYDFSKAHLHSLNAASRTLEADFRQTRGSKGAKLALDKMSVGMANRYGQGHPTMSCSQLKQETRDLARNGQSAALDAAADRLLSEGGGRVALVARQR